MNYRFSALLIALLFSSSVFADPPTANPVTISGTAEVGLTLSGSYVYGDVDGDAEDTGGTSFRWLRDGGEIAGATGQNYTLTVDDEGAMIIFEVTPVALTNELVGSPTPSAAVGPVAPANTAPTASGVNITGTTEVGSTLTGNYTYNDADGDPQGTSQFQAVQLVVRLHRPISWWVQMMAR